MMKMGEFIKYAVPFITTATAVMVAVLNFTVSNNDHLLRARDQELTKKIGELDLLLKQSSEKRAERESSQDFNLKIYDIVTKSLEERSPQKQEAAKAFIVVMVDEPLRSSLLHVLKQGGDARVKKEIGRILKEEEKFKNNDAVVPQKQNEAAASYNWGEWDFDIFWCTASGATAKKFATAIGEELLAEGAKGRIRVRELPESINARQGYQIDGFAIRRNANEKLTAEALKQLSEKAISTMGRQVELMPGLSRQETPWYISVFVCPNR